MATAKEVLAALAALAGENEAVVGSNNTTVNKYFKAKGQAYCGYSILYAMEKAGCRLLDGSGAANVGNLARFCESKGWRVTDPRAGDIFVMRSGGFENGHTGFVYETLDGGYFITLEGNYGAVKATAADAKNGTGSAFEGIGYRKAKITSDYKFYRPPYDGAAPGGTTAPSVGAAVTVMVNELRQGSAGPQVKTVQRVLYAYGLKGADGRVIVIDGEYGANTAYAVKTLQAKLGVAADGIVGKNTWKKMLTELW